jgi:hypothetical protein
MPSLARVVLPASTSTGGTVAVGSLATEIQGSLLVVRKQDGDQSEPALPHRRLFSGQNVGGCFAPVLILRQCVPLRKDVPSSNTAPFLLCLLSLPSNTSRL